MPERHASDLDWPSPAWRALRALLAAVLVAVAMAAGGSAALVSDAAAQQSAPSETTPQTLDRWDAEARLIQDLLDNNPPRSEELAGLFSTIGNQLERIPALRTQVEASLEPLREQLAALGDAPEAGGEAPQIAEERARLQREIAALEDNIKRLDQAEARARGLEASLTTLRRSRFTEQLVSRGPSVLTPSVIERGLEGIAATGAAIFDETRDRIADLRMTMLTVGRFALPLFLLAGAMALLFQVKRVLLGWLVRHAGIDQSKAKRVAVGVGMTLARLLIPAGALLMALTALRVSGLFGPLGLLVLSGLAGAAYLVIGAYALSGAFFSPHAATLRLSKLDEKGARRAHRRLIVLAAVVGLDRALVVQGEQIGLSIEGLAVLNVAIIVLGATTLWRFIALIGAPPPPVAPVAETVAPAEVEDDAEPGTDRRAVGISVRLIGLVARLACLLAPALALLGYYAGARYAFYPLVFSGAVIGFCVLLFHVVQSLVSSVGGAGGEQDPAVSRLQLIPILVAFLLACAAAPILALIWGVAPSDLVVAWRTIVEGFKIGDVRISPTDFILFLLVASIGYLLTRQFKALLRNRVLPLTGLDTGGRDAVAAGAGYLGLIVTMLVAISATGVDLSNLAIVAGALSVGIGFGLQNIVNNFVSGIILLIERPIKAGDWIELPSGMGYVKNINVRSTEVETFDRASLFVPNSQLISENVINWTHSNLNGRLIVKVGVDYGSDPRHVERILQEIGRAHPLMLRRPAPYVLFRGFGADSLDFEIRGVLRDVNWILNVQSDMHYEIARRFREEGISVPFRQHDIEIKRPELIAEAIRSALGGRELPAPPPPPPSDASAPARAPTNRTAAGKEGDADHGPEGDGDAR